MIILKDGVRYINYEYTSEGELEKMVIEHYKEIFGKNVLFFGKQKIETKAGVGAIPDGFAITFDNINVAHFYVLEIEVSSHSPYKHAEPQLKKFKNAVANPETRKKIVDAMYSDIKGDIFKENSVKDKIGSGEIHKFLSDLVTKDNFSPLLVIDKVTNDWEEAFDDFLPKVKFIEFKTFVRENVGLEVHIHLFETLTKISPPGKKEKKKKEVVKEITPQEAYRIHILEALVEMGGKGQMKAVLEKVHEKMEDKLTPKDHEPLPSGTAIRWKNSAQFQRQSMKEEGLLKSNSPWGIWEITKKGEDYYRSQKQTGTL